MKLGFKYEIRKIKEKKKKCGCTRSWANIPLRRPIPLPFPSSARPTSPQPRVPSTVAVSWACAISVCHRLASRALAISGKWGRLVRSSSSTNFRHPCAGVDPQVSPYTDRSVTALCVPVVSASWHTTDVRAPLGRPAPVLVMPNSAGRIATNRAREGIATTIDGNPSKPGKLSPSSCLARTSPLEYKSGVAVPSFSPTQCRHCKR